MNKDTDNHNMAQLGFFGLMFTVAWIVFEDFWGAVSVTLFMTFLIGLGMDSGSHKDGGRRRRYGRSTPDWSSGNGGQRDGGHGSELDGGGF